MKAVRFIVAVFAVVGLFAFAGPVSAQGDDPDCGDFASQAEAQAVFNRDPYNDPFGLDGPIGPAFDGVQFLACEGNPPPTAPPFSPVASATPTATPVVDGGGMVSPSASAQPGLPNTGAADGMTGLALGLSALLLGAGVGAHVALRRREV